MTGTGQRPRPRRTWRARVSKPKSSSKGVLMQSQENQSRKREGAVEGVVMKVSGVIQSEPPEGGLL